MPLAALTRLFTVPPTPPGLARAQLQGLRLQVPLLYLILNINALTLARTYLGQAPTPLVLGPPALLAALCAYRSWNWLRLDIAALPAERHLPLLRRTNRLCILLGPAFLTWALALSRHGDRTTSFHAFFFVAITTIACVFCLMHLRSAALIVVVTVIGPFAVFTSLQPGNVLGPVALNHLLVCSVMVFILVACHRDFTRLVGQNEELDALNTENQRLASTDMLTGLPNRRSFFPALDEVLRARGPGGGGFSVGVIDLDGFKQVNDTNGHLVGDRVLAEVAERFGAVVPAHMHLARVGGDEFALIVPDGAAGADLSAISAGLLSALDRPFQVGETSAEIGATIGYAHYPEAGATAAELVERADFALYHAKGRRRGTWVMFSREHEERLRQQGAVEHALRHARLADEFTLAYQPIVDVETGRTVAFEALARWTSPSLGAVPPDRFIPVMERTGLITTLTRVLLAEALDASRSWPAEVGLSFNLSTTDIASSDAMARLCDLVGASDVDPGRIQFEVTETALVHDFAQAQAGLGRLKALGARLALDDFGRGYCSLNYVHHLAVDKLKVDKSFTRDLLTRPTAPKIVRTVLDLCRSLDLDGVVEGVETEEQAVELQRLGCRLMQGYLFARPMSAAAAAAYLVRPAVRAGLRPRPSDRAA